MQLSVYKSHSAVSPATTPTSVSIAALPPIRTALDLALVLLAGAAVPVALPVAADPLALLVEFPMAAA